MEWLQAKFPAELEGFHLALLEKLPDTQKVDQDQVPVADKDQPEKVEAKIDEPNESAPVEGENAKEETG